MATLKDRVSVTGSDRAPLPKARITGPADPHERMQVSIIVRRRSSADAVTELSRDLGARQPRERQHLSRKEFASLHGAHPDDLEKIRSFADEHGLEVVKAYPGQRRVVLAGTVAAFSKAFGVELARYEHPGGSYRGRVGSVYVPKDLAAVVEGVFGLDDRTQARPHFRAARKEDAAGKAAATSYLPTQVAKLYDFPSGGDGNGESIGIIELGGGYRTADLKAYFARLGLPAPRISSRSIDGGKNRPTGDPNGPDGEVMLDIEVAGAVAPKAKIVVYFAPNTDAGFLDAIASAVHDTANKPSVISISWGAAEKEWTAQAMNAMDQAFQDAAALGVTVCCASGDGGSADGETDGLAHVDFPASSPHALACGGTHLEGAGSTIRSEVVWNDGANGGATGGGISDQFAPPAWQSGANVPPSANPGGRVGRGVPDVAGDADPATGYVVRVDGQQFAIGGTSAVAPLWAGLIARINQRLRSPIGFVNPLLYQPAARPAFHDVTAGNNGAYHAQQGWDPCTGLGSPDGAKLQAVLGGP
ncbi:MAG TPA: S53 family peptidase [Burkholderiales bacterium]|nr:S53 family peptidase [Burkholderiales bacterium]